MYDNYDEIQEDPALLHAYWLGRKQLVTELTTILTMCSPLSASEQLDVLKAGFSGVMHRINTDFSDK